MQMGKSRADRRSCDGEISLYPAETSLGWRVIGTTTRERGREKLVSGEWREVYDEHGNFWGYQVLANFKKDEDLPSGTTSTSITVLECILNAEGLRASRTAGLPEEKRISRKSKCGVPLPPEDAIERAVAKVAEFGRNRLVARSERGPFLGESGVSRDRLSRQRLVAIAAGCAPERSPR